MLLSHAAFTVPSLGQTIAVCGCGRRHGTCWRRPRDVIGKLWSSIPGPRHMARRFLLHSVQPSLLSKPTDVRGFPEAFYRKKSSLDKNGEVSPRIVDFKENLRVKRRKGSNPLHVWGLVNRPSPCDLRANIVPFSANPRRKSECVETNDPIDQSSFLESHKKQDPGILPTEMSRTRNGGPNLNELSHSWTDMGLQTSFYWRIRLKGKSTLLGSLQRGRFSAVRQGRKRLSRFGTSLGPRRAL